MFRSELEKGEEVGQGPQRRGGQLAALRGDRDVQVRDEACGVHHREPGLGHDQGQQRDVAGVAAVPQDVLEARGLSWREARGSGMG